MQTITATFEDGMRYIIVALGLLCLAGCNHQAQPATGQSDGGSGPQNGLDQQTGGPQKESGKQIGSGPRPPDPPVFLKLTFSPSGRHVLLCYRLNYELFAPVLDVVAGKEVGYLRLPDRGPSQVKLVDETRAVAVGPGNLLGLRDIVTDKVLKAFDVGEFQPGGPNIQTLDISPDGSVVVTGGFDGTIAVWDVVTGKRKLAFQALHGDPNNRWITTVRFLPDGKGLLSHGQREWKLWDIDTGREIRTMPGSQLLTLLAVTPDSKSALWIQTLMLPADGPFPLVLKDLATDREVQRFEKPGFETTSAVFAKDGRTLFSAQTGYWVGIRCWDVATGKQHWQRPLDDKLKTSLIALSPDLQRVVSLNHKDGVTVNVWDLATGKLLHAIKIEGTTGR
jgi:WD40 repeat protein